MALLFIWHNYIQSQSPRIFFRDNKEATTQPNPFIQFIFPYKNQLWFLRFSTWPRPRQSIRNFESTYMFSVSMKQIVSSIL